MKKKYLLSVLAIFLILALTGCGPNFLNGCGDSMQAEQTAWDYWRAITNRQYELAKFYCVPGGIWYNKVDEWEEYININSQGEASLMIYEPIFYKPTEVIGDTAIVYIQVFVNKIPFPGSSVIYGDTFEYEVEVIQQDYPPGEFILK